MKDLIKGFLGPKQSQTEDAWVSPASLHRDPIQQQNLTHPQLIQIEAFHETFAGIDGRTIQERIDTLLADPNVDRHIAAYSAMVSAFRKSTLNHSLSSESQKELYQLLLLRSTTSAENVFAHITLKSLPRNVANDAMVHFERALK